MDGTIKPVDIHTHILPGIDDGANDAKEAAAMLAALQRQKIGAVVLTPHYDSTTMGLETFLERRARSYAHLTETLPENISLPLVLGSETFLSSSLFNCTDITPLCIGGRYLLVELPYSTHFTPLVCQRLMKISYAYGVYPILAHVERYPDLLQHPKVLESLVEDGLLTQINVSSWSAFRMRRCLQKLIKRGLVHFLGSDCHHLTVRPPEWRSWICKMEKSLGKDTVQRLLQNAMDILPV